VLDTHTHKGEKYEQNTLRDPSRTSQPGQRNSSNANFEKRQSLQNEYHSKLTDANREHLPFPTMPDFPSSTDIIAQAEALKKFVDQA
jgi:hypothetical protein